MKLKLNEIGSDFWRDSRQKSLDEDKVRGVLASLGFVGDCRLVLSGRTAIDIICQDMAEAGMEKTIYLPAYSCDSMIDPFMNRQFDVRFYDVSVDVSGIRCHLNAEMEKGMVYINNYFGYSDGMSADYVETLKRRGALIIYDMTHALFNPDNRLMKIADYVLCSLRKWANISTGAVVCKNSGKLSHSALRECGFAQIKERGMQLKYQFLCGYAEVKKEDYFRLFNEFNEALHRDYINYSMDKTSLATFLSLDFNELAEARKSNALYLYDNLCKGNDFSFMFQPHKEVVPLFVPLLINKGRRGDLRNHLTHHHIYCPVHWPKSTHILNGLRADRLYDNEISLVCDQRYSKEEMHQIVVAIKHFFQK